MEYKISVRERRNLSRGEFSILNTEGISNNLSDKIRSELPKGITFTEVIHGTNNLVTGYVFKGDFNSLAVYEIMVANNCEVFED